MKRYLVFVYESRRPVGGWIDFTGDYDDFREAMNSEKVIGYQVMQVVDTTTREIIFHGDPAKVI